MAAPISPMARKRKPSYGFALVEILMVVGAVAFFVAMTTKMFANSITVDVSRIQEEVLSPCMVGHAYSLLGQELALSSSLIDEIKDTCANDGQRMIPRREWKSFLHPAKTPSSPVALALNERRFTAHEWARALNPLDYELALSTEASAEKTFSFWEYDQWYWDTNTQAAKGNAALTLHTVHQRVLAEKERALRAGVRSGSSQLPML